MKWMTMLSTVIILISPLVPIGSSLEGSVSVNIREGPCGQDTVSYPDYPETEHPLPDSRDGPGRSLVESDVTGGSWFDGLEDDEGIASAENLELVDGSVRLSSLPCPYWLGHWSFDEGNGSLVNDSSENARHGTLLNMEEEDRVDGYLGDALSFDGNDEQAVLPYFDDLRSPPVTWEAWVYPESVDGQRVIVGHYLPVSYNGEYFGINDGKLFLYLASDILHQETMVSDLEVVTGRWQRVSVSRDPNSVTFMVDDEYETHPATIVATNELNFSIGGIAPGQSSYSYHGMIDEVSFYDRGLSPTDLRNPDPFHEQSGLLVSQRVELPSGSRWSRLSLDKLEAGATEINVSVLDADTGENIPGYSNRTEPGFEIGNITTRNLSFRASFNGNGSNTPVLDSWGAEWTAENAWRDGFTGIGRQLSPFSPDNDTMALWHFDEGGGNVAEDASGSSNNATFEWLGHEPGSGWCGGRFGGGIYLDGDDDFAVVESGIDLAGRSFTLEAWVWVEEGDGNQFIWGQGSAFSGVGLHVGLRDSNAFTFAFYNNDLDTADSFLSRVWQYWACTYDAASGERKIYLDGRGVAEDVAGPFTGSGPFYMGRAPWGGNFHGIIDEVRISRIPRTGEEIRDVFTRGVAMENGRAILALAEQEPDAGCVGLWSFEEGEGNTTEDLSAEENRGSIDGARWAAGLFGRSLMFDGDEEVDCGNDESLRSAETTVECWINPSDFEKNYQTIVAKSTKDQDGYAILMHDRGIVIEYSTSGFHRSIQKTNCLEPGRWYHLALTYSQDYMRGYIDGQEFNLINYHMEPPTSRPLTIGSGYDTGGVDGTQGFHGLIDSVQVYDRVLSAREIRRHSYIHRDNATLCSEVISVPPGNSWEAMHVSTILPYGTYLNVSVCDAATGEELINMTGRSEDRTTRLLAIHILEHSDIYLEARFTANRNASPILLNWGLNWTLITEPSLISEIGNQSLEEDSHDAHVVDLSLHFHDAYAVAGETQFQPVNLSDPGQMNLSFNGTWLVVDSLAENYTGTISLAIRCTNTYELWTLSNPFNITIIGTEDPPAWILPLPTVELDEDTNVTTNWSLSDYSLEADGDELSYSVASSSEVVKASVDPEHRLSVNATDDFFGRAELSVSVSQTNNGSIMARNATVAVIVNAVNDPPWTELLSPVNGHIQRNSGVTLQWNGFDLDDDKEDLSYDVYLGEEPSPSLHKEGVSGDTMIIDDLESGRTYYWHVIAHDGKAHGSSRNGTWNFTVDPDHFVPNTELVSPGNATVINTTTVNLTWELRRPGVGALSYRLYGGPSPSSLGEIHHTDMRWYVLRGLRDGISYYWTVIPVAGGVEGICPSGVWHFKVNKSFDSADLIKVKFEPASVELEQGESAMINMTLNNTSGDVVTARIRSVGNLSGLVHLPGSIVVGPREEITVGVRISNTSILLPSDYVVSIEVSHPGGWRTFSFPLKITEKDPNPNGGNGSGAGAGSTVSGLSDNLPLIILVCALSMALAVILIFFLRRSRKDESKEEAPDDHRAGKPEAKGALRVEDTPRTGGIRGPPLAMESPNEVQFAPELAPDGYSYVPSSVPGLPDATAESAGIPAGPTAVQDRAPASSQSGNEGLSWSPEPMPKGPQIVGVTGGFAIRDIFLIYVDGRLVESASFESHLRESMDQDIMSGMLTAITDFIKDSFKEDSGALKSLEYGKMNIYLERGVGMYIAVVFQGNPPEELREKMRWLLIRLWKEFKYKLKVWDGSMDGLEGLEKMLLSIMEEVEPEEEMTASPAPSSASPADRVPILSKAEKAVMCGICMGVVKPGLVILNCPCGAKYHKTCGDRVDNCPKCGISLTGAKSEEEAGTMAKETVVEPVEEHIEELIDDPVGAADPVGEPVFPDFPPSGPYSDSIPSEVGLDTIFDLAAAPPTYGTPKDIAHPEMPPPPDVGSAGKIVPDPDAEVPLLPEETESRKAADEFKINV